jgi:hypothetical protein
MAHISTLRTPHRLANPHAVAERLERWSEQARRHGRIERSVLLVLAAWTAYDLQSTVANEREAPAGVAARGSDAVYGGKRPGGHGDWKRTPGKQKRGASTVY